MSVFYRLSQVTSPKAKGYGKWYPRAVITETIDTDKLAEIMQRNCTVKMMLTPLSPAMAVAVSRATVATLAATPVAATSRMAIKVWGLGPSL